MPGLSSFPIEFASPLGAASWAVLAGVPVGIIALYFLKLRRRPVQVSSTLLWRRSIEDLHVNSLFQRLRRNLLLFLQLLAVLLAMLALAGPRITGTTSVGQRYVLAIDESASMRAKDMSPSRLDRAKSQAREIIQKMRGDDLAMIIAFSDKARVVSPYTANRALLLQRLDSIRATEGTTSLREALQVAAGLANPSKQVGEGVVAASVVPPRLYIYTDGGFPDVSDFSLGNLVPEVVVIGPEPPPYEAPKPGEVKKADIVSSDNVAILALQSARNDERPDQFQVFGRVHNYRDEEVSTEAKLLRHDPSKPAAAPALIDAIALTIPARADQSFKFDLPDTGSAELEVRIDADDALPLDNRAFTIFGNPRKAQVLLVVGRNRYLTDTLQTPAAAQLADVLLVSPEQAKSPDIRRDLAAGRFDLVIFDSVRPEASPEANTLYFGALPPGKAFEKSKAVENPVILDWDIAHPLMQYIRDLNTVLILKAQVVEPPAGSKILIESDKGPLAFAAPRGGYVDTVVTFGLLRNGEFNTNWPIRFSFPMFLFNALRVLGNARESAGQDTHLPGEPVVLRADSTATKLDVYGPDGRLREQIKRSPQGTFVFDKADVTGIYHARWGKDGVVGFTVNLFDPRESDLAPRGLVPRGISDEKIAEKYQIKIGYNPVQGTVKSTPAVKDWWYPIAIVVLGIMLLEWYIYNRRVYV